MASRPSVTWSFLPMDAGHRAVSIWMQDAGDLSHLLDVAGLPADQVIDAGVPQELTTPAASVLPAPG